VAALKISKTREKMKNSQAMLKTHQIIVPHQNSKFKIQKFLVGQPTRFVAQYIVKGNFGDA